MSTEEETKAPEEAKAAEGGDDAHHEGEENTAHFEPVVSHDFLRLVAVAVILLSWDFFDHISLDFLFSIQVQLEEVEVVSGEEEEVRFALSHCRALDQSREVPSRQLAFSPRRRLTGIL